MVVGGGCRYVGVEVEMGCCFEEEGVEGVVSI